MAFDAVRTRSYRARVGRQPLRSALNWLVNVEAAYRERQKLRRMSDIQLQDLGLSRSEVEQMSRRPAWDAPIQFR